MYLIRNSELLTSFCATHSQYAATVFSGHALAEAVLVVSFPVVGLKSSFHDFISFILIFCVRILILCAPFLAFNAPFLTSGAPHYAFCIPFLAFGALRVLSAISAPDLRGCL